MGESSVMRHVIPAVSLSFQAQKMASGLCDCRCVKDIVHHRVIRNGFGHDFGLQRFALVPWPARSSITGLIHRASLSSTMPMEMSATVRSQHTARWRLSTISMSGVRVNSPFNIFPFVHLFTHPFLASLSQCPNMRHELHLTLQI